jgi:hypothetical protein
MFDYPVKFNNPVMGSIIYENRFFILLIFCSSAWSSCTKNLNERTSRKKPEVVLRDVIDLGSGQAQRIKILQLHADTVYLLTSNITREEGEQLIVDPGTLIKSNPGIGIYINKSAIVVANGTEQLPIIFTSNLPAGSANNYWQGITISGKSFNNTGSSSGDPADASGSLRYVRIEFAGLSLIDVGAGTTIENVQTSYSNLSPAFLISGGNVNGKYLVSYACGAPADFYIGNGYSGKLQYLLAYRYPFFGSAGSKPSGAIAGLYIENNETNPVAAGPATFPFISNLTVIGPAGRSGMPTVYKDSSNGFLAAALVTNRNASFRIRNSIFMGYPVGGWQIGDSLSARKVHYLESEFTSSIVYCADSNRTFYIRKNIYRRYDTRDFKEYMLEDRFHNRLFYSINSFGLNNVFGYDALGPVPADGSVLLKGADFSGDNYGQGFFDKVEFVGAVGRDNWLRGWTNFNPLKTNYNIPE